MAAITLESFKRVIPMIYAYRTPGVSYNEGWLKIGYTERQSVESRIRQQVHTAGIIPKIAWKDNAMYKDGSGEYFTDHDFHAYLERKDVERRRGTEWFHVDGKRSREYFDAFASRRDLCIAEGGVTYTLRAEQEAAVAKTLSYLSSHGGRGEFLWNAKPRFGKTLAAYDFVRRLGAAKTLIVTNRPSIANSWLTDFNTFIRWHEDWDFHFVSEAEALAGKDVMTREDFTKWAISNDREEAKMIAFDSLQDLKGSKYLGGQFDKLKWIADTDWDVLIVDEAHEGVDTTRTETAFRFIRRKFTLHLSGTPFKALARGDFSEEQIFNWSYADEQEANASWQGEARNPYEELPRLSMYTYRLSEMIRDKLAKGLILDEAEGAVDYAFDLNEFFKAERGRFLHEEDIKKFLHALTTQEKYPFSTEELRDEMRHTLWLLERVESAKALARLLAEDPVFSAYHVVLAAGDGKLSEEEESKASYDKVVDAISHYPRTITLSVGQLTTGVTIPEWAGVLMLSNMKSPAAYMQAAFRAQNPAQREENAYVFDFDPARTLTIYDDFANNLSERMAQGGGTAEERAENIRRLLNFFPVLGEDDEGRMEPLDAAAVLSIPRKLKSEEVVKCGFMNNFLFQNISNIFAASDAVRDIVEKIAPAQEQKVKPRDETLGEMETVTVDEEEKAEVPDEIVISKTDAALGEKIYEKGVEAVTPALDVLRRTEETQPEEIRRATAQVAAAAKSFVRDEVVAPVAAQYGLAKGTAERLAKQAEKKVDRIIETAQTDFNQRKVVAEADYQKAVSAPLSEEEKEKAETAHQESLAAALRDFNSAIETGMKEIVEEQPKETVRVVEEAEARKKQSDIEETVRAHLRGFSRTIPSFLMAYGDEGTTLKTFDRYVNDAVFHEVTGITLDEFRFLRDGGPYTEKETGEEKHFDGHLFDEVVFDDSVKVFLGKKAELADYFDESAEEDIFDYIPPQKTNQIFTPRRIVSQMVDMLEENNPGIFADETKTFADLYMKSGLYITEIVKRLYRNPAMKRKFPDDRARLRHILTKQVYGFAPTEIIYRIATNYIFGAVPDLAAADKNFRCRDAVEYAKAGKLAELVEEEFGK